MKNRIDLKTLALVLHFYSIFLSKISIVLKYHTMKWKSALLPTHQIKVHVIYNNSNPRKSHFNPIISSFFFYYKSVHLCYIYIYVSILEISVFDVCLEYVSIYFEHFINLQDPIYSPARWQKAENTCGKLRHDDDERSSRVININGRDQFRQVIKMRSFLYSQNRFQTSIAVTKRLMINYQQRNALKSSMWT